MDHPFETHIYDEYRPTVSVVAVVGWSEVLLVQPNKCSGSDDRPCWILPQGGVEQGQSPLQALEAKLKDELSLGYSTAKLLQMYRQEELVMLGSYINECRDGQKPKLIVLMAMPLTCPDRIRLNDAHMKRAFAKDRHMLKRFLVHTRPVKSKAILRAVSLTDEAGLIGWRRKGRPSQAFKTSKAA